MSLPLNSTETFRFSVTNRDLTAAELAAFVAGGKLPAGVGEDATSVLGEYQSPTADDPTSTSAVVHDGTGEYHFSIVGNVEGAWRMRGLAFGPLGEVLTATLWSEATFGDEARTSTVGELVASVLEDGQLDASEAQALRWLNVRHKQMCSRSRCYRRTVSIGPTVDGQASYPVPPGVVEILQVTVGGLVYGTSRHNDFAEGERGYVWLGGGEGGIAGREDSGSGQPMLRLFPAPKAGSAEPTPGAELEIYAAMQPPPLVVGQDSTIKVPDDYFDALVSGALATAFLRVEARQDLAAAHEQIFSTACGELTRATNRRFRGTGPARVRILGINA